MVLLCILTLIFMNVRRVNRAGKCSCAQDAHFDILIWNQLEFYECG